jgi:hypothetical protein
MSNNVAASSDVASRDNVSASITNQRALAGVLWTSEPSALLTSLLTSSSTGNGNCDENGERKSFDFQQGDVIVMVSLY